VAELAPIPVRLVAPDWVDRVPAPAHDSLSPAERRRYLEANPDCYLTVTRSPEDLAPGQVWDPSAALAGSRSALQRLIDSGAFTSPEGPALYLYRLTAGEHSQIGIVGGVSVDDYDRRVVRIHEQIKVSRANHLATQLDELGVQSSPITLAHRPNALIEQAVAAFVDSHPPAIDVVSADGLHQEVWEVADTDVANTLRSALADDVLYLIDGHHRAAAASTHKHRVDGRDGLGGPNVMLCAIFPSAQLRNEAFHRWLRDIEPADLLAALAAATTVRPADGIDDVLDRGADELALWVDGDWYLVDAPALPEESAGSDSASTTPLDGLDPVRLERRVLEPLLGIDGSHQTPELTYLHGVADRADLESLEKIETGAVWVMRPVPMDVLMAVSDAGLTMPPKSTYFVPKVRSGVFLRSLR
jgi:uncharacterized protein (DUF1015 family)